MEAFLSFLLDNSNDLVNTVRKNTEKVLAIATDERLRKYQIVALSLGGDEITPDYVHDFDASLYVAKGRALILRRPPTGSKWGDALEEGQSLLIPRGTVYRVRNSLKIEDLKVLSVYSGVQFLVREEQCSNIPPEEVVESESSEKHTAQVPKKQKPARGSSVPSSNQPNEDTELRRRGRKTKVPDLLSYDEVVREEVYSERVNFLEYPDPSLFPARDIVLETNLQTLRSNGDLIDMQYFQNEKKTILVARIYATLGDSEKKIFCGQCRFDATNNDVVCLDLAYIMKAFRGSERSLCSTMLFYALEKVLTYKATFEQVHIQLVTRTPAAAYLCYRDAVTRNGFELVEKPRGNPQGSPRVGRYTVKTLQPDEIAKKEAFKTRSGKKVGAIGSEEGRMVYFDREKGKYITITIGEYMQGSVDRDWSEPLIFIRHVGDQTSSYAKMQRGIPFIVESKIMNDEISQYNEELYCAYIRHPKLVFKPDGKNTSRQERKRKKQEGFFSLPQWLYKLQKGNVNKMYDNQKERAKQNPYGC